MARLKFRDTQQPLPDLDLSVKMRRRSTSSAVTLTNREGSALFSVVLLLSALAFASLLLFRYYQLTSRVSYALAAEAEAQNAAENAINILTEKLLEKVEWQLGKLDEVDIAALNAELHTLDLGGVSLDLGKSRYEMSEGSTTPRASLGDILAVVSDQPRFSFEVPLLPDGELGGVTQEVSIVAEVVGRHRTRGRAEVKIGVARVRPYQHVLYTEGDLEACASAGSVIVVSGSTKVDGAFYARCNGEVVYVGPVLVRDSIWGTAPASQQLAWSGGSAAIGTLSPSLVREQPEATLHATSGNLRIARGLGDILHPGEFQDALTAGRGECRDFDQACNGTSSFFPSAELRHSGGGLTDDFDLHCGWAYDSSDCTGALRPAISYLPFPFVEPGPAGAAWPDPYRPGFIWQGLFPDYRREGMCTFTVGLQSYRTFRCPTNAFGYTVDVGLLPEIPGGLLSFRRMSPASPIVDPYQEVVLLRNAQHLAAPLAIVSELPVYIEGSFNTIDSKPALIDAPTISILPTESFSQLQTAALWDSTTIAPQSLQALSSVGISAILRATYHVSDGSSYYGGTLEQIPAVVGDFGGVTLTVTGAIEGLEMPLGGAGTYSSAFQPYGEEPSGIHVVQPASRHIRFDSRLRDAGFQIPGSWSPVNLPATGAGGTRSVERQSYADGGYTIVFLIETTP